MPCRLTNRPNMLSDLSTPCRLANRQNILSNHSVSCRLTNRPKHNIGFIGALLTAEPTNISEPSASYRLMNKQNMLSGFLSPLRLINNINLLLDFSMPSRQTNQPKHSVKQRRLVETTKHALELFSPLSCRLKNQPNILSDFSVLY